ncbi:C6 transcription factor (Acr-2) [Xylona heveae TC161]|uniref:C6 transcription factor (Acr-2) n=1 Tax=Xylona heveae (strain CBS 132557 / TC161) TaxID=1328760 RepID=A0A165IN58_XYLHT|nr:C6 transcription factor (Acr-2) [Xylona heveae TC161]KZF25138.1 C6 transcription factor (Acr-2) [Xylona heveae TC161]
MEAPAISKSCYTCRRRRIQCDRSKTPCLKCEKAGLDCFEERPLRWVRGVAIRGGMRGRSFAKTSAEQVDESSILSYWSLGTRLKPDVLLPELSKYVSGARSLGVPRAMIDVAMSSLDSRSRYYLDYYNDRICKVFIVYDSEKNPFRSLIPLGLNEPVLLETILALAARHLANAGHLFSDLGERMLPESVNAHCEALHFKHRAIQGLASTLRNPALYQKDATIASVFLLVFLDLLESGCDRWNYHLEGAKRLMTLMKPHDPGRTIEGIRHFITNQIHLIESLGTTFVRPNLVSKFISAQETETPLQDVVEQSFLGCPGYILSAVQHFSVVRDRIADGDSASLTSADNQLHDIISVQESIKNFDCHAWAANLPQEQSAARDVQQLSMLSRSYQLGASLYGQRVLDAITQKVTPTGTILSELIEVIGALRDDPSVFKCILWPIFVAGLECKDPLQRTFLIQSLETFWEYTYCLNVINAARILQEYWAQEENRGKLPSQWIFNVGRQGRDWLLI